MEQEIFKIGDELVPKPNRTVSNGNSLADIDYVVVTNEVIGKYRMICTAYYKNSMFSPAKSIYFYKDAFKKKYTDYYEIY